ncbi:hypothetical protein BC628DRAFT_1423155 [Trametes gibbosa]|uniref:CCHC-type domain-containing protein n=1 Tax=Trametes gibbosa TaxID=160864 RepID=A0A6G6FQG2_9APHY|nr:hypothetical protein BC628DRAFT_1423155 [Trametes gibbosa]QIE48423.1 hypothetical protein [Trametes gibbosa]
MQFFEAGPFEGAPLYTRCDDTVLGVEEVEVEVEEVSVWAEVRRCFNCGSEDHAVSGCPERINRALVSLTRQLFDFHRGKSSGPAQRLHEIERWRLQRLHWLEEFDPGQIRGPLLRDALGLEETDPGNRVEWLYNMAHWGYPPGWIGERDPRERVWQHIAWGTTEPDEECEFTIFTDEGEEKVELPRSDVTPNVRKVEDMPDGEASSHLALTRWAAYPNTYADCSILHAFQGEPSPEVVAYDHLAAYMTYWQTSQALPAEPTVPPPPPPSSTPPPLPPSRSSRDVPASILPTDAEETDGTDAEEDMDLSD